MKRISSHSSAHKHSKSHQGEPSKGIFGEEVTLTDLLLIKQGTVEGFFKDSGHSNSHLPHTAFQEESPGREKVKLQIKLLSVQQSCYD